MAALALTTAHGTARSRRRAKADAAPQPAARRGRRPGRACYPAPIGPDRPLYDAPIGPKQPDARPATRSVVLRSYKDRYAAVGTKGRGNGDALYAFLLTFLDGEGKLDVPLFERFLDENGVKHAAWSRTSAGWQGRLRMSGSVVLRAKIKRGEPITWNGDVIA